MFTNDKIKKGIICRLFCRDAYLRVEINNFSINILQMKPINKKIPMSVHFIASDVQPSANILKIQ